MKGASSQGGFTVVETMIVLAVTGLMVMGAILLVSGQQNRVEFQQSIQDVQARIQEAVNEVGAGYYPSRNNLICQRSAGAVSLSTGNREQGTNTGCIFLGKALQFGESSPNGSGLVVHTIAGLEDNSNGLAAGEASLDDADPTSVARGLATNSSATFPDASVTGPVLYGLTPVDMYYFEGATRRTIGAVAFVNGLGRYEDSQLLSGTQQVDVIPVNGSGPVTTGGFTTEKRRVVDAINTNLAASPKNPTSGVRICFASGGTRQSGLITIGSSSRGPSVTLDIKGSVDCS